MFNEWMHSHLLACCLLAGCFDFNFSVSDFCVKELLFVDFPESFHLLWLPGSYRRVVMCRFYLELLNDVIMLHARPFRFIYVSIWIANYSGDEPAIVISMVYAVVIIESFYFFLRKHFLKFWLLIGKKKPKQFNCKTRDNMGNLLGMKQVFSNNKRVS